ncbi:MAG: hypothetical protein WA159_20225 [Variovorax sp.]
MTQQTLNPMGSDGVAFAEAIAPAAARRLLKFSEALSLAVFCLAALLLAAVIMAVRVDFEVVAVTPGGTLLPLVQIDQDNEGAQRALLGSGASETRAPAPSAQAPSAAGPGKPIPTSNRSPKS